MRPEVIAALGKLVRGGGSMDARANAARAMGILRGKAAMPDLVDALRTKDTDVIYESLVALQKIRDESAGPQIVFLLRDLDPKVQIAAIETTGCCAIAMRCRTWSTCCNRTKDEGEARGARRHRHAARRKQPRRSTQQYLHDKDEKLRAAAAEGFARLRNPADSPMLEKAWKDEGKPSPRLSLAFAQVMLGKTELSEFSPLQFLINNLNSAAYKGEAYAVPGGTGARQRASAGALRAARQRHQGREDRPGARAGRAAETRRASRLWRS